MSDIALSACCTCTTNCCRRVPVTVVDVARIWRRLRVPLADFVWTYVNDDPVNESYVFQVQGQQCSLVLKGPEDDRQRCPFTMKVGSRYRCGIYDFRPAVCHVFPVWRVQGQLTVNPHHACSASFLECISEPEYQRFFDGHEAELKVQEAICAEWNTSPPRYPSSLARLLEFVQDAIDDGRC